MQLVHELAGGLKHAAVIDDHAFREVLHVLRLRGRLGELACVDIDLIGRNDDRGDLWVGGAALRDGHLRGEEQRSCPCCKQCVHS